MLAHGLEWPRAAFVEYQTGVRYRKREQPFPDSMPNYNDDQLYLAEGLILTTLDLPFSLLAFWTVTWEHNHGL
jgi:hypothetical protein